MIRPLSTLNRWLMAVNILKSITMRQDLLQHLQAFKRVNQQQLDQNNYIVQMPMVILQYRY